MATSFSTSGSLVDLTDRVAVVTGAGQGIGYAIARRLHEAGAITVLTDVSSDLPAAAKALQEDTPQTVETMRADASSEADQEEVANEVFARYGRLDIWVNNAGVYPVHPSLEITAAQWRQVLGLNLDGTFFGARAAARHMTSRGQGVILNVASTSAYRVTNDGVAHYAASKSGVKGLTRALAREYGPSGVRVLAIAPVLTTTESTRSSMAQVAAAQGNEITAEQLLRRYAETIPLRRTATADDIARVALFCVSDLASYVTGQTIPVDGGYLAV